MRDLFEKIYKDKGPLGKWAEQAEGYFVFPKLEGEISQLIRFYYSQVKQIKSDININLFPKAVVPVRGKWIDSLSIELTSIIDFINIKDVTLSGSLIDELGISNCRFAAYPNKNHKDNLLKVRIDGLTKSSSKKISANFLSVVGTNQTQNDLNYNGSSFTNNVSVNGSLNKFTYLASFGNRYVDGISAAKSDIPEKDPFSRFNTNLKIGYKISNAVNITVFGSYDKFKTDIDGFPAPTFTFADTNDEYVSEQSRFGIAPKFSYTNGSVQINAAYTKINRETISAFGSTNEAESFVFDAFNKYVFNKSIKQYNYF